MLQKMTDEYKTFANKLILTSVFTIVLSTALQSLIQSMISMYFSEKSGWIISVGEIIVASVGLYFINKNGKGDGHAETDKH